MKKLYTWLFLLSFLISMPVARADEGMWTYDNLPLKQWKERYSFAPTSEWLDNIRLASVKLGTASAGFVSPNGLLATNHHVASGYIARLSTKEKDLMKDGFYARTLADELKAPGAVAQVLVSYENVTQRVHNAVKAGASDSQAAAQRGAEIAKIESESNKKTGLKSDVISLYSGGEYWLYRFKRYDDVRLVMAPEEQAAFFGGDYDNFTFPRHDLDFTFLRVYENGKPAKTPNYFKWSASGPKENDFVIATGYPGSTARLMTVAQLAYARDYGNPLLKQAWELRRKALEDYSKLGDEEMRQASGGMRSGANSLKRLQGQQDGLLNPRNFAKKEAEEKDLRTKLGQKPELEKQFVPAWANIENAYKKLPAMSKRLAFSSISASMLGDYASRIVRYHEEIAKPDSERLPEYKDARLDAFRASMTSAIPVYSAMEQASLSSWLNVASKELGANDQFIKAALGQAGAAEVAAVAVQNTKLGDPAERKRLIENSAKDFAANTDPMIALARRVEPVMRDLRKWEEENISNVDAANGTKIAEARFAVYGKSMPPDANSNLRVTYGAVKGYEEDTTLVPYKTTFFGLYDRALGFDNQWPFQLSNSLQERRDKIDLTTPLNFVYSADTIGGNSGSPVINREAELVGLNFDSNVQKLSNRYWYIEENEGSRAVAVHSAGIIEALRKVYDAEPLVNELIGTQAAAVGNH